MPVRCLSRRWSGNRAAGVEGSKLSPEAKSPSQDAFYSYKIVLSITISSQCPSAIARKLLVVDGVVAVGCDGRPSPAAVPYHPNRYTTSEQQQNTAPNHIEQHHRRSQKLRDPFYRRMEATDASYHLPKGRTAGGISAWPD